MVIPPVTMGVGKTPFDAGDQAQGEAQEHETVVRIRIRSDVSHYSSAWGGLEVGALARRRFLNLVAGPPAHPVRFERFSNCGHA
jgi:hypothetical protein